MGAACIGGGGGGGGASGRRGGGRLGAHVEGPMADGTRRTGSACSGGRADLSFSSGDVQNWVKLDFKTLQMQQQEEGWSRASKDM